MFCFASSSIISGPKVKAACEGCPNLTRPARSHSIVVEGYKIMTGRGRPAHPPGGCLPVGQLAPLLRGRREVQTRLQCHKFFFSRSRRRLTVASAALTGRARLLQHSREQTATRQWTTASRRGSYWKSVSSGPKSVYQQEGRERKKHRLVLVYCRYRIQGCSTLVHAVAPKTHTHSSLFTTASQTEDQSDGFLPDSFQQEIQSEIKTIYRQIM